MSKIPGRTEIRHCRTIESLQKALDQTYHHLLETARADWQRLFASGEPSDACVTVRVSEEQIADELASIPAAGLALIKRSKLMNGGVRRRRA